LSAQVVNFRVPRPVQFSRAVDTGLGWLPDARSARHQKRCAWLTARAPADTRHHHRQAAMTSPTRLRSRTNRRRMPPARTARPHRASAAHLAATSDSPSASVTKLL